MEKAGQDRINRAQITAYCMYFTFGVVSILTLRFYLISMEFYPAKYQLTSIC